MSLFGRPQTGADVEAEFETARQNERAFIASCRSTSVSSSGGTLNMNLANPSGSGNDILVEFIIVSTQFEGQETIHDSFSTAPSGGTSLTIDNMLMDAGGGTDSGNMSAAQDVSFTADGTHFLGVIPSGGASGTPIGGSLTATSPIIEPGREIVIEAQNDSTAAGAASIGCVYSEQPTNS